MQTNVRIEGTLQWLDSPTVGQGPRLARELDAKGNEFSRCTANAETTLSPGNPISRSHRSQ